MIKAIKNGQTAEFSEAAWDLLGENKEGWVIETPTPPAEVAAAMKPKAVKQPTPPAEVAADKPE